MFLLGGIARKTIYDLLNDGELASVVIGRRRFIPAAAITSFIGTSITHVAPAGRRATGRHRVIQVPLQLEPQAAKRARRAFAVNSTPENAGEHRSRFEEE